MLYLNAYEVTLGNGGSEEGGWWYDIGTPLASIPIASELEDVDCACHWRKYGSREWCGSKQEPCECRCHERLEVPTEPIKVDWLRSYLKTLLDPADEPHPDKSSMGRDAHDIEIVLEDHIAEPFGIDKPQYC